MTVSALAGVRVIDLADESAALTTRILADLGADVVKVEPPDGCRTRHMAPFLDDVPGNERSFFHLYYDANKRSVVVDRTTDEGAATFRRLVESADVLVETTAPNEREALGLAPEQLRGWNPRLVQASVVPFASDGAWAHWRGGDLVGAAASGLLWVCGEPGRPPVQGAAHPAFTMASLAAASGVMIALNDRDRAPDAPARAGSHLEVSLQEAACMAAMQTATPTYWTWYHFIPGRPGLSNAVRCRDGGYVALLVRAGRFGPFVEWCDEAGIETKLTVEDAHWAELTAPREGNPVSKAILELADRFDRDAFAERAAGAEIVCLPILDFPSMARNAHYRANEQFLEVAHERLGRHLGFPRSPVDAMAGEVRLAPAPALGEHTEELAQELAVRAPPRLATTPLTAPDPTRALAGIRVVDFCWVLAGPIGTRILASFGADVIRVESTHHADGMRSTPGPDGKPDTDLGGLFNCANAGKRSLTVNLQTEQGRALVRRLVAEADVVTNNYRPGALERMGFGYDALREIKPDIVLLNLPGTHKEGPWSGRPTMGNVVMAASGFNLLMGFPDQKPRGVGVAWPDFTSPQLLATTVLAALRERAHTGRGQELDLSQLSATISLLGAQWMQYHATGLQPPRGANRDPNYAPHGVYPAKGEDAWCAIAVRSDAEWARLCRHLGRPELADDERFGSHAKRKENEDALDEAVAAWTRDQEPWELAGRLQADGIAAAPVENLRDTLERDPQLVHHYQRVRQPAAPELDIPIDREAIRFPGFDHRLIRSPILGEHNEPVVRELLGLSEEEYTRLVLDDILT